MTQYKNIDLLTIQSTSFCYDIEFVFRKSVYTTGMTGISVHVPGKVVQWLCVPSKYSGIVAKKNQSYCALCKLCKMHFRRGGHSC